MKEPIDPIAMIDYFRTATGQLIRLRAKSGILYLIHQTEYFNGTLEVVSVKTKYQSFKWFERFVSGEEKHSVIPMEVMVANA